VPATALLGRAAAAALLVVWANHVPTAVVPGSGSPAVLGGKVTRCSAGGATLVEHSQAIHRLAPENAPLTVFVKSGRLGVVLAPATRVKPGTPAATPPRFASIAIAVRPDASGAPAVTMTVRNLSDCDASVSLVRAVASRKGRPTSVSSVRFGGIDHITVPAGGTASGNAALSLSADGVYELGGSAYATFGPVR
jgi:hypothetical protein